jgi:hypothetical protein
MPTEYLFPNPFKQIWLKCHYFIATLREFYRYPYVLIGELCDNTPKTILMYRMRGKRDTYQQTAEEICNNAELISQFHPIDVRTIAYICGIEQAMEIPAEKRSERFAFIKNRVFKK